MPRAETMIAMDTNAFSPIKQLQHASWSSGNFAVIGTTLQIVGEMLAESADVRAGERVIDIAAGNGNATLAAARRHASVTAIDYVPALLEKAASRARAEGFEVEFEAADAEYLPFEDAQFDAALSTFGIMFAPDHARAAKEALRVVRPGGRIALASWTIDGFLGEFFQVVSAHAPLPAGFRAPMLWGDKPHVLELFRNDAAQVRSVHRTFNFRYRSPRHWIEVFRAFYGGAHNVFSLLDAKAQAALDADLVVLLARHDIGRCGSLVIPGEYLETVITRR